MTEHPGTIRLGEHHPAADNAFQWVKEKLRNDQGGVFLLLESLYSTALSGSRNAEICAETLRRILNGEMISDRYLLGLAWTMRELEDLKKEKKNRLSGGEI